MKEGLWTADYLGGGLEMKHIAMPDDYSGMVICTLVRKKARNTRKGVLYIHGFSDYFFQRAMADEFVAHGYSFYAVDLRKYGRSILSGQKRFEVRDLHEYFPDIEAGVRQMKADGCTGIVLMGHSTGGLTATLYMEGAPDKAIKALVLNSPFLAWNLPTFLKKAGVPLISAIGRFFPSMPMKSGGTIHYNAAIASHLDGEWDYNTAWKPDVMPDVDAGWIRAIERGQEAVEKGWVEVPVLLMHSLRSVRKKDPLQRYHDSDGVLDVDALAAVGRRLGPDVTEVAVEGGLHDLVLSRKAVRDKVYETIFDWLGRQKGL